MDYSEEEVVSELKKLTQEKTRVRVKVDKKCYLIALLYYKFFVTEEAIGSYCNMNHSSINYSKKKVCDLFVTKNKGFMDNVNELYEKFPYDFTAPESVARTKVSQVIKFNVVLSDYKKEQLASYMNYKNIESETEALKELIFKALTLWGR
jgi:hypothetical protein